jgi:nicotinamide-nucleotide adenylyltransferase
MKIEPSRYYLIPVPDSTMHACWASTVVAYCPLFHVVYSNEPLTRRLFREAGRIVRGIPMFQRELYSATEIRQRILTGKTWRELLPKGVVAVIEEIKGVERLRELAETDSPFAKKLHG